MKNASFETDLTDAQWEYLKPMLAKPKKLGRPPTDRRVVLNAILYVLKGGIAWRLLPQNFPAWKTVYHVFRAWSFDGTWAALNDALRICVRADCAFQRSRTPVPIQIGHSFQLMSDSCR